jgi:hypothetical protein
MPSNASTKSICKPNLIIGANKASLYIKKRGNLQARKKKD